MTTHVTERDGGAAVTVLGLGPMGAALASAFLAAGHRTTMWNRTAGRAAALVDRGAAEAESVATAVAASPLTVLCVVDYSAARQVLDGAGEALRGRTLVNLTGGSPRSARELADWAAERGVDYLDGSIMAGAATIGGDEAAILYAGSAAAYARHEAKLSTLAGSSTYLGPDPGRAAAYEVALLDLFWTSTAGAVHAFAVAAAENIAATDLVAHAKVMSGMQPYLLDEFAKHLDSGHFPGDESNLDSAAASIGHVLETVRARGLDDRLLAAAYDATRRAIERGHGAEAVSRIAEVFATHAEN